MAPVAEAQPAGERPQGPRNQEGFPPLQLATPRCSLQGNCRELRLSENSLANIVLHLQTHTVQSRFLRKITKRKRRSMVLVVSPLLCIWCVLAKVLR